jgi:hypothetical protein
MTPEERFKLIKLLLERGAEVTTFYKRRRVAAVERTDGQIVVRRWQLRQDAPARFRASPFRRGGMTQQERGYKALDVMFVIILITR